MSAPNISFEFFPPKSLKASFRLWDTVKTLAPLQPTFVSVTYGAGGTTRKLTHEAVTTLTGETGLKVSAHLTCVGATRSETLEIADQYAKAGISDIVALRGDPADGADTFTPVKGGFTNSIELIEALKTTGNFHIRVGAYPDPHPEAADMAACVDYLKAKFDAGADSAITQFFFEADTFLRFRDACEKAGITKPIIPGILPIQNWASARKFATRCGTVVPTWLDEAFSAATRDDRERLLSTALATELCSELIDEGVEDLHFYTLNSPDLTREICAALGITPKLRLDQVA